MSVAENVRTLRESKGLQQQQLAQAAGISKSALSHIEHGRRTPSAKLLPKLAEALEVEPDHLMGDALTTRSVGWRITGELLTIYGACFTIDAGLISDPVDARLMLEHYRRQDSRDVRAVRVETIETVEVW